MGLKEGWAGGEKVGRERDWAEREGEGFGFLSFFKPIFLKPFLKLNSFQTLNTSNSFQNFQIIFKTFKTSHHHI
jgi:hypothetical protein